MKRRSYKTELKILERKYTILWEDSRKLLKFFEEDGHLTKAQFEEVLGLLEAKHGIEIG